MNHTDALLLALAPGHFVSGEDLAVQLGISRAAIWKQLRRLQAEGVPIDAVRGRGYRVAGGNPLLTRAGVQDGLTLPARSHLRDIELRWRTGSTNTDVLERDYDALPAACLAEMQTAGRGRQGRQWLAPFGAGIWLSVGWPFPQLPPGFAALGLVAGIAAADALRACGVEDIGLKWPNDLVVHDRKLGGLLVETRGESAGRMRAAIGVGINWNVPRSAMMESVGQPWTDLVSVSDDPPARAATASQLLNHLCHALDQFERGGFSAFAGRWSSLDVLAGRDVRVQSGTREISGRARGIDAEGALIVDTGARSERCTAGEVSVRPS